VDVLEKARICGQYAEEKKAKNVLILELIGLTDIADYFLLVSGTSERHVRTISEFIGESMKDMGIRPLFTEGYQEGRWIIMDYSDLIVHVFLEELRELYDLESLWIEAKQYRLEEQKK